MILPLRGQRLIVQAARLLPLNKQILILYSSYNGLCVNFLLCIVTFENDQEMKWNCDPK